MPEFFKRDKSNYYHVVQDGTKYLIRSGDKKKDLYIIEQKIASTKSIYTVRDAINNHVVGEINNRKTIPLSFTIAGDNGATIAEISIEKPSSMDQKIKIKIADYILESSVLDAGKSLDFKDANGSIVFTLDKKILHFKDAYKIVIIKETNRFVAVLMAIVIDDIFFSQT